MNGLNNNDGLNLNALPSSQPSELPSPLSTANVSSDISNPPPGASQDTNNPATYTPPAAVPTTPSPPPSATVEKASSTKSTQSSTSPKTQSSPSPQPPKSNPPAKKAAVKKVAAKKAAPVRENPSPPPSATGLSPSGITLFDSKAEPGTKPQEWPSEIPPEPAKDPVQGCGGLDYLEWAATYLGDVHFRELYHHRAGDLIDMHQESISESTMDRLLGLAHDQTNETLAGILYDRYCEAVGGIAFNGDPLPGWLEFRGDESKQKQSDAWVAVADTAVKALVS